MYSKTSSLLALPRRSSRHSTPCSGATGEVAESGEVLLAAGALPSLRTARPRVARACWRSWPPSQGECVWQCGLDEAALPHV